MAASEQTELLAAVKKMIAGQDELRGDVAALGASLNVVAAKGKRSWRNILLIWLVVLIDILSTFFIGYLYRENRRTQARLVVASARAAAAETAAKIASNNLVVICAATNASNAKQRALWEPFLVNPQIPPNESPAAKARREEQTRKFQDTLNTTFAQQDCKGGRP